MTGGDLLVERELWRVEAGAGRAAGGGPDDVLGNGVFDLSFDGADGRLAARRLRGLRRTT